MYSSTCTRARRRARGSLRLPASVCQVICIVRRWALACTPLAPFDWRRAFGGHGLNACRVVQVYESYERRLRLAAAMPGRWAGAGWWVALGWRLGLARFGGSASPGQGLGEWEARCVSAGFSGMVVGTYSLDRWIAGSLARAHSLGASGVGQRSAYRPFMPFNLAYSYPSSTSINYTAAQQLRAHAPSQTHQRLTRAQLIPVPRSNQQSSPRRQTAARGQLHCVPARR